MELKMKIINRMEKQIEVNKLYIYMREMLSVFGGG